MNLNLKAGAAALLVAAVAVGAPAPASAQTATARDSGEWLQANVSSALGCVFDVWERCSISNMLADVPYCEFSIDETAPGRGGGLRNRTIGSFQSARAAFSSSRTAVQIIGPLVQEGTGGGNPRTTSNSSLEPFKVRDPALAEQFVRHFNVVSQACGGPGTP